jgi:Ala-tRNA(Pro) deacylase
LRLIHVLSGVEKGSVTPLGLFNDRVKHAVHVILDKKMIENDNLPMIFHPLTNDYSTQLTARELKLFLQHTGHEYTVRDFTSTSTAPETK